MKILAKLAIFVIFSLLLPSIQANPVSAYRICGGVGRPPCNTATSAGAYSVTTHGWTPNGSSGTTNGYTSDLSFTQVGVTYEVRISQMPPTEMTATGRAPRIKPVMECPDIDDFGGETPNLFLTEDTPFFENQAGFLIFSCKEIDEDCYNHGLNILIESGTVGGLGNCPCDTLEEDVDTIKYYSWVVASEDDQYDNPHYYCIKRIETDEIKLIFEKEVVDEAYRRARETGEPQVLFNNALRITLEPEGDQVALKVSGIRDLDNESGGEATGTIEDVSETIDPESESGCPHKWHHKHHHNWLHKWNHKWHHKWHHRHPHLPCL